MNKGKVIDFLTEDEPISGQKFGLISIVGPNMPQKCDVWGLKIRGVCDNLEKAKQMTKKIMKMDNKYDIYTVEIGKFFPLNVEPYDIKDVEYENEQLNLLVKSYLENKEKANEHFNQRKSKMIEDAIREGKKESQEELAKKPEHPIAVLQRKKNLEQTLSELQEQLNSIESELNLTKEKYKSYSEEERMEVEKELESVIKTTLQEHTSNTNTKTIEEIRNEIMNELNNEEEEKNQNVHEIENLLSRLNIINKELQNGENSDFLKEKTDIIEKLNKHKNINEYLNDKFETSDNKYHNLFN